MRISTYVLGGLLLALLAAAARGEHDDEHAAAAALPNDQPGPTTSEEKSPEREREGTRLVSQLGRFKTTGDRLTFHLADSERQYLGLENLALERIGKVLADRHDQVDELQWEVTGVFTEYRGVNFLLVTQAVLKSKSSRGPTVLTGAAP